MNEANFSRPFAVVTGASSGIGLELAKRFAIEGYDLLLVAETGALIDAKTAIEQLGASAAVVEADLTTSDGVHAVTDRLKAMERPVDAIAINAGVGVGGPFLDTSLEEELKMIDLNVKSSVHLAKHVLPEMVARNRGKILFTSSVAAVMPSPFEAVYGATKAFLLLFSESLANELKDTDVSVTAILPGPTETNFFHRAEMDDTKAGTEKKDDPAEVAERAYKAMMAGKEKAYVGSFKNRVMGMMADLLPDDLGAAAHRKLSEPGSATVR